MPKNLPEFEELAALAQNNPEALEALRKEHSDALIDSAPDKFKRRLRGLQFQIDMEIRKAPNPMASCIRISQMMHESFGELRTALNSLPGNTTQLYQHEIQDKVVGEDITAPATVLSFPSR